MIQTIFADGLVQVSLEEGALCEPLSVGVYACQRSNLKFGDSLAIFGAGPIGLVTLLAAKAFGASTIIVTGIVLSLIVIFLSCYLITDINDDRLAFAKKAGATHIINVQGKDSDQVTTEVTRLNGDHVDISIDW